MTARIRGVAIPEGGARLTRLRAERGLTKDQLAKLCGVGGSTITRAERGERITVDRALRISSVLLARQPDPGLATLLGIPSLTAAPASTRPGAAPWGGRLSPMAALCASHPLGHMRLIDALDCDASARARELLRARSATRSHPLPLHDGTRPTPRTSPDARTERAIALLADVITVAVFVGLLPLLTVQLIRQIWRR